MDDPVRSIWERFGVEVTRETAESFVHMRDQSWSDGTWFCWVKNRLWDRLPRSEPKETEELATAVLHVFFISLEETEEMLEALRINDDWSEVFLRESACRLQDNLEVLRPIDRVAARVVRNWNGLRLKT